MLGEHDDESDLRIQLWQNKDVLNFEAERHVKVLKMEMFLVIIAFFLATPEGRVTDFFWL
jgi:hypothetical protein